MSNHDVWSLNINKKEPDLFDSIKIGELFESGGIPSFAKINIPEGDSETPKAKPVDGTNPSIPGGSHAQQPSGSNPKSASTTITADAYNNIIKGFKQSFKEMTNMFEFIENVTIVDVSPEQLTESAAIEAAQAVYDDGPMYEAAKDPNKANVKTVAKDLRKKLKAEASSDKRLNKWGSLEKDNVAFIDLSPRFMIGESWKFFASAISNDSEKREKMFKDLQTWAASHYKGIKLCKKNNKDTDYIGIDSLAAIKESKDPDDDIINTKINLDDDKKEKDKE